MSKVSDLLTVKEVAELKGISRRRVNQIIDSGDLKAEKVGSYYVIRRADADALQVYGKPGRPSKETAQATD